VSQTGRAIRASLRVALFAAALWVVATVGANGQTVVGGLDTTAVVPDPADIVSVARAAQSRFERRRIRLLPLSYEPFGGSCDEVVGRICTTYGEGEWYPQPERPEIIALRSELLAELDSLQRLAPDAAWILGQRAWYRAEGGDWDGAITTARGCGDAGNRRGGAVDRWWCHALEGFGLHGAGRYVESEAAFQRALVLMDDERARRWRVPRWPVDAKARDLIDGAQDGETRAAVVDRLWALGDPLYLVEGNDRLTAHYARWTVTELRERARNPFRLSWADDLSELTVRHGWQVGWERAPARDFSTVDHVIGHQHPLGRDYLPSGETLQVPESGPPESFRPNMRRPRSLYAPGYAPVLLPMDAQIGVFPRVDGVVVLSGHRLPPDTTFHAGHDHPVPWLDPGDQAGMPDRLGLFALDLTSGRIGGVTRSGRTDGASRLHLAEGRYVLSAESWSPSRRRAGRTRVGLEARAVVPDIASVSDLVLLRTAESEPETLDEAIDLLLPTLEVPAGRPFGLAWEVGGLGFRSESLAFALSIERTDRGVLSRVGDFLGLSSPPTPLDLSWEEPGPGRPGPLFRSLTVEVPDLQEGRYEIRLILRTPERSDVVAVRRFDVVPPT